jgi:glycosyltransferase involved in cell wall biosynthesis
MHVLVIPSWFAQYPGDPSGSFFATQAVGVRELGEQIGIIYPDLRPVYQARRYLGGKIECSISDNVNVVRNTYINWTPRIEPLILPRWLSVGMRLFDEYCARFGKPDVIHAHCLLRAGVLASRIARKHRIPYVVTEHSSRWHNHEVTGNELRLARAAAKDASALISVSTALLLHLRQDLELDNTYVLPNAVDSLFLDGEVRQQSTGPGIAFINVALLNPGKRQDLLIDGFQLAFGTATKNTLSIVGDGPERNSLEKRIARYGMQSSIRLLGMQPRSEVVKLLGESDCLALTSDHETFGVVVIEALAKGLPVISTDCGGTTDIVTCENGIVAEKGNVQAIAAAMASMQQRIEAGTYDKQHIRADCIKRFSQQSVCAELLKIYKEAVK